MAITINLTAVLITAIICLTLCYICKRSKDEEDREKELNSFRPAPKAKEKVIEIPRFVTQSRSGQEQHLVEYVEEQARKRGDIEP